MSNESKAEEEDAAAAAHLRAEHQALAEAEETVRRTAQEHLEAEAWPGDSPCQGPRR